MRTIVFLLALVCAGISKNAWAQQTSSLGLGDTTVRLVIHQSKETGIHFLNLHDDENTSVKAALQIMEEKGGMLTELKHGGERLVTFNVKDQVYQFDPNRMFTPAGRRGTLRRYGRSDNSSEIALGEFADSVLSTYGMADIPCIVTLHNNSEEHFSAKSYLPGAIYDKDARKVYLSPGEDPDNFVVVTRGKFYRFYKRQGMNVVWQSKTPTDDGSLSVYAGQHKIPYINIEAQEGHLEEQKKIIEATYRLLTEDRGWWSWLF